MHNPFTPTFGIVPPYLAGRSSILADMRRAFKNGLGDPALCSIIIGPRGSGKTALLSCAADEAREQGYIVAATTAIPGMLEDILQKALSESAEIVPAKSKKRLTGLTIGQFLGMEWKETDKENANWRARITNLLKSLQQTDTGLLITVDEVRANMEEMVQLAAIYQLLIREGAKCALIMAGLSVQCNRLLEDDAASFLRRARQYQLERISDPEMERAIRNTVDDAGKKIGNGALKKMVAASAGYPYMMQLVGFETWEESGKKSTISEADAERGIDAAVRAFRDGVLKSTYHELSKGDRAFLMAMSDNETENRISDIAARMKKTVGYASSYRNRMLEAGIVEESVGKTLVFTIPFLREYLETLP